jgi:hypothetical protein
MPKTFYPGAAATSRLQCVQHVNPATPLVTALHRAILWYSQSLHLTATQSCFNAHLNVVGVQLLLLWGTKLLECLIILIVVVLYVISM